MLESEGFVQVVPRKGVVVRQLSRRDVEELFDVREALEVLATRRAAESATPEELRRMRDILDAGDAAFPEDPAEAQRANEAFHDALIAMAHNDLLASLLEPLQGRLHWLFRQNEDVGELGHEHRRLYDAIASGDADRAGALALEHVQVNRAVAVRLLFGDDQDELDALA
jgi:DNA-binding GntR family transcriptional regulator